MKNEREKEIENVDDHLNRNRKRRFRLENRHRRQDSESQLTDLLHNGYITISRPHWREENKGKRVYFRNRFHQFQKNNLFKLER